MSQLSKINEPANLKNLSNAQLAQLAEEIRETLIDVVSNNGGHLASNLGVVELTIALHKCFDSPNDQIVWDVGHQCYTHKILTGRKDEIYSIRTKDGVSGFPKPYESAHDPFVAGHSSTSISAALGMAEAKLLSGDDGYVIAVIGDGAFTGGMVYEALNNAGKSNAKLIIILNDNEMSISKNVGSIAGYFSDIRTKKSYYKIKDTVTNLLERTPVVGKPVYDTLVHSKSIIKSMVYHNTFFEDLGFDYLGPVDGHNIDKLCSCINRAKNQDRPSVIHINTQKGRGYQKAEENPGAYHGVPKFDVDKGNPDISLENSYSTAFGKELVDLARKDDRICAITAAMKYGTGLQFFYHRFPHRFYDVGIAEEHAVTFAAGLATNGMKPVFCVYSTFSQRCIDQLIHDVALQKAGVILAIDRAGIVGQDGETHQGIYDVSLLSNVPNCEIYSPSNYSEMYHLLHQATAAPLDHLFVLRYPRGCEDESIDFLNECEPTDYKLFSFGQKKLVVTYGRQFAPTYFAAQKTGTDVLKLTKLCPLNEEIYKIIMQYDLVYFVEEGVFEGGVSQKIMAKLCSLGFDGKVFVRAIFDKIVPQAKAEETYELLGLDQDSLVTFLMGEAHGKDKT